LILKTRTKQSAEKKVYHLGEVILPTSRLPLDIKQFLIDNIDSIAHLEVLLKLFSNPEKNWNAEDLSKEMRSNISAATIQLVNLQRKGLIKSNDDLSYRYEATNAELNKQIENLVLLYHDKPVAVVSCIYEKPTDKLKGFADAFKLKKD
jgi:hypothetical protein